VVASIVKRVIVGASLTAALGGASAARAAPFVYVTNFAGNNISQFNAPPLSFEALTPLQPATIAGGDGPFHLAISPDGRSVYVTNNADATLSQYSVGPRGALSGKTPASVATGASPDGVAVSPDGKSVYVANDGNNTLSQYSVGADGALSPKTPATVPTGDGAEAIAVSPDGTSVYVTTYNDGTVWQYTVGAGGVLAAKVPATIKSGTSPGTLAVAPDGKSVYVANLSDDMVWQYSVGAGGALSPKTPATVATGKRPDGMAVSPDGKSVYVTNVSSGIVPGTVSQYSVGTGGQLVPKTPATVRTGNEPEGVAVSPDGKSVYVTDYFYGTVSQYSVGAGGLLSHKNPDTVGAGSGPWGVAVGPDADVSVTISMPKSVKRGSALSSTIKVKNGGPSRAWLASFTDRVPAGTEFLSANTSRGNCTGPPPKSKTGTLTCQLGTLPRGSSVRIQLGLKVTARPGKTVANKLRAASVTPDPKASNNTAKARTRVTR
jgi:uncharacterized repeat protein (TIGR01451 family)